MSNFKPQATFVSQESYNDYRSYRKHSANYTKVYNTYAELKKELPKLLEEHIKFTDDSIFVSRSRRGQWGEYFEKWDLINGKAKITKQGWM
jgi:hypothetical protein